MKYHRGGQENPYVGNTENNNINAIDRGTYHGIGVPKAEMIKFNRKSTLNKETQKMETPCM